jgi:hypothetical protein
VSKDTFYEGSTMALTKPAFYSRAVLDNDGIEFGPEELDPTTTTERLQDLSYQWGEHLQVLKDNLTAAQSAVDIIENELFSREMDAE